MGAEFSPVTCPVSQPLGGVQGGNDGGTTVPTGDVGGGSSEIVPEAQVAAGGAVPSMDEPSGSLDFQEGETVEGFDNARVYKDDDGNTFYGFTDENGLDHLLSQQEFEVLQALDGVDCGATEFLDSLRNGPGVGAGPAPEGDLTLIGPSEDVPGATVYEDADGDRFYSFTPPNADGTPGSSEVMLGEQEVMALQETPEGREFLAGLDGSGAGTDGSAVDPGGATGATDPGGATGAGGGSDADPGFTDPEAALASIG